MRKSADQQNSYEFAPKRQQIATLQASDRPMTNNIIHGFKPDLYKICYYNNIQITVDLQFERLEVKFHNCLLVSYILNNSGSIKICHSMKNNYS